MLANSPTRSSTSSRGGAGSDGSRPQKASNMVRARSSGNVHDIDPMTGPSSNRTVATSHRDTGAASSLKAGSSHGSTTAKKLRSATVCTASRMASGVRGPIRSGNVIENIFQYLRAEGLFEIAAHVEVGGFVAPCRRSVGGDDHANEVAPAVVLRDLAQQFGAA